MVSLWETSPLLSCALPSSPFLPAPLDYSALLSSSPSLSPLAASSQQRERINPHPLNPDGILALYCGGIALILLDMHEVSCFITFTIIEFDLLRVSCCIYVERNFTVLVYFHLNLTI